MLPADFYYNTCLRKCFRLKGNDLRRKPRYSRMTKAPSEMVNSLVNFKDFFLSKFTHI